MGSDGVAVCSSVLFLLSSFRDSTLTLALVVLWCCERAAIERWLTAPNGGDVGDGGGQRRSPRTGEVLSSLVLVPKADASSPDADPTAEPKREDLRGGLTPLMTAAGAGAIGAMEALLDALPDDAARLYDVAGMTSVSYAAQAGQAAAVRILLARGGSAGGYTVEGRAPLHLAAYGGLHQCAAVLVKDGNAPVDMRSKEGHTALIIASFQVSIDRSYVSRSRSIDRLSCERP